MISTISDNQQIILELARRKINFIAYGSRKTGYLPTSIFNYTWNRHQDCPWQENDARHNQLIHDGFNWYFSIVNLEYKAFFHCYIKVDPKIVEIRFFNNYSSDIDHIRWDNGKAGMIAKMRKDYFYKTFCALLLEQLDRNMTCLNELCAG